jgi:hypothetical protein
MSNGPWSDDGDRRLLKATVKASGMNSALQGMRVHSQAIEDGILNETVCMTEDWTLENERRGSPRFKISAPVTVIAGSNEIPAYTRDLSNRGVYFYLSVSDSELIGRDFELLIEVPSEITLSTSCRIRCRGKLLRKEIMSRNLTGAGIAAEIVDYSILREQASLAREQ